MDTVMDVMNFSAVHVACDDCSTLPSKENQIPFRVNCNHYVLLIHKLTGTKSNTSHSKQFLSVDSMLQCPFVSIIVFKNPD